MNFIRLAVLALILLLEALFISVGIPSTPETNAQGKPR